MVPLCIYLDRMTESDGCGSVQAAKSCDMSASATLLYEKDLNVNHNL